MTARSGLRALTHRALAEAAHALAARDADLARLVRQHGVPPMWGRRPGFGSLVRIILEQQVSLSAARTLFARLETTLGGMTPDVVADCGTNGLRALGLTRQKSRYLVELATRLRDGQLDLATVARAPDEHGRRALLEVPGIGPWTTDIYYLMVLRRPDVWPTGDLALAISMQQVKSLPTRPSPDAQRAVAQAWAPWRSVAARILWQDYLARLAAACTRRGL